MRDDWVRAALGGAARGDDDADWRALEFRDLSIERELPLGASRCSMSSMP